ncbi:MAG TPA: response regulator [Gaiellaceae bacterium]|nr:response regulator [Gaiellaceae bacterium]
MATQSGAQPQDSGGYTVLVVDDEEAVRRVAALLLEAAGYTVLTAATADEALGLVREQPGIDAVLLDLMLPDRSGASVAADLRRLRPAVPIVVSSGYDDRTVAERVEGIAGVRFLRKPYAADDLMAALVDALPA